MKKLFIPAIIGLMSFGILGFIFESVIAFGVMVFCQVLMLFWAKKLFWK